MGPTDNNGSWTLVLQFLLQPTLNKNDYSLWRGLVAFLSEPVRSPSFVRYCSPTYYARARSCLVGWLFLANVLAAKEFAADSV
jgi:hypothetical protein